MAKYIIHACNSRMWYVDGYLVPSMLEQGINKDDIIVWLDKNNEGNLPAFLKCMEFCGKSEEHGFWHLQDDVIISRKFKEYTERYDTGLVAGFASSYDSDPYFNKQVEVPSGTVNIKDLWYSFCCIRIPNLLVRKFLDWWIKIAVKDGEVIRVCINDKKNDDWAFRRFIMSYYPDMIVQNLKPNLVDHIDYIIGGSIINKERYGRETKSLYFEDTDLIEQLKERLGYAST